MGSPIDPSHDERTLLPRSYISLPSTMKVSEQLVLCLFCFVLFVCFALLCFAVCVRGGGGGGEVAAVVVVVWDFLGYFQNFFLSFLPSFFFFSFSHCYLFLGFLMNFSFLFWCVCMCVRVLLLYSDESFVHTLY